VRLHVLQAHALRRRHARDRRDLIQDEILSFAWRDVQVAASEADEIREPRMRADGDAVLFGQPDRVAQHRGIAAVETGSNVRRRDRRHQSRVVADGVGAERLAHIGVEVDSQGRRL